MEMGVSEREAVFESLDLNPQLFINESLNRVDDLLNSAFDFYEEQASTLLKTEGTDRADDLSKGVASVRDTIQSVLDKRLSVWESYCLQHCFSVPEGFTLPKTDESSNDYLVDQDALTDPRLDAELDSLRKKLSAVGKEAEELGRVLQALDNQCAKNNYFVGSLNEIFQSYEQQSGYLTFQEMARNALGLRMKIESLRSKMREEIEHNRLKKIRNPEMRILATKHGPFNANLEDLQGVFSNTGDT